MTSNRYIIYIWQDRIRQRRIGGDRQARTGGRKGQEAEKNRRRARIGRDR
jgi:hypothetical protein